MADEFKNLKRRERDDVAQINRYTPCETDQIGHSTDGEVEHYVHVVGMDCINGASPVIYGAPVRVENGKVEGRIT